MLFHQGYPHLLVVRTILFSVISPGVSSLTGSKNNFVQSFHQGYPHLLVVRTILFSVISPGVSLVTLQVERVFTLPIRHLASPINTHYTRMKWSSFRFPVYLGGPRRVWGLTSFVLDMMLFHLLPEKLYSPISIERWNSSTKI